MDEMIFYFKADGDSLTLLDIKNTAYTGNANTYICKFELSKGWEMFNVFAVFTFGENAYTVSLSEDNSCIIPYEILQSNGIIYVGLFGTNSSETQFKRISTNCEALIVGTGAYSEDATSPAPPTPDVWEKLINRNIPKIGDSGNWYIWDIEKNEYTDSGASSKGDQGPKGDPGYTPQKGVDYFTESDVENLGLDKKEDIANKLQLSEIGGDNDKTFSVDTYTDEQYLSAKAAALLNYYLHTRIGDLQNYTDALWDLKANNATNLAGYGITDAYTKTEVDSAIQSAILDSWEVSV